MQFGPGQLVVAILGLAVLMIIHESGHFFVARHYGMRVVKFSIGFGPTLWRHQPAGSPTVYQVALIPFLAYVQIAGMNPFEESASNTEDPGSYANASLKARIATIAAGPAANYFAASVVFFLAFLIAGKTIVDDKSMRINVAPDGPAAAAQLKDGDRILAVNGEAIRDWDQLRGAVSSHPGEVVHVDIERDGARKTLDVTPSPKGDKHEGKIQIGYYARENVPVSLGEAAKLAVVEPAGVVVASLTGMARMITGREKAELSGPVGIVREVAKSAALGPGPLLRLLGALSAYLAVFNLLPLPALDGGRLVFLGFEAAARRKPDARVEQGIHAVGLLMMLALIAVVTIGEVMPGR